MTSCYPKQMAVELLQTFSEIPIRILILNSCKNVSILKLNFFMRHFQLKYHSVHCVYY